MVGSSAETVKGTDNYQLTNNNMHAPQLIYICLVAIGLGIELERHGKEKTGTYNFWSSFISTIIVLFILHKGGFFN